MRLVISPNEGSGLVNDCHRKAKLEWGLAWYDRYVLGDDRQRSRRAIRM